MATELYIIRHGIAADHGTYSNDDDRPLTSEGRQKTEKVAKRLDQLGLRFDLIQTSPLVRALQTAKILQSVGLSSQLLETPHLAPGGNIQAWISELEEWRSSKNTRLALVGHQPSLTNWAEILIWGEAQEKLVLKKAGVIGLTLPKTGSPIGNSQMFWLSPPKFLL